MAYYEDNLRQSGYNKKLTYKPTDPNHQKHSKHKRKIIWCNPLFSKNVSTKIGTIFIIAYSIETKSKQVTVACKTKNQL